MTTRHLPWKESCWAIGFVAMAVCLYVATYRVLVRPDLVSIDDCLSALKSGKRVYQKSGTLLPRENEGFVVRLNPAYAIGGDVAKALFAPIHELDVAWRRETWHRIVGDY